MSTTFEEVGRMAETQLKKLRWALGISGALSIALGVVIIVWPGISLYALVLVFGAFALARGIVGLATAFAGPIREGRGWLVFWSLVSIAVGVIVFFNTQMSALALLYVIGAYAIVLGAFTIGGAFWLPLDGGDTALLAFSGLVSIVFGVVMFAKPGDGALVLLALIAAYALIVGLAEVTVAIGGKRLFRSLAKQYAVPPAEAHPSR
jgi:uncharacterized membrane protein HdeD (DUF308 family)